MYLYPMHEKEKQTKEQREAITNFLLFLHGRRGVDLSSIKELSAPLDEFFGIDRVKYAEEELEMAKVRRDLEARKSRGERAGSSVYRKAGR